MINCVMTRALQLGELHNKLGAQKKKYKKFCKRKIKRSIIDEQRKNIKLT